MTYEKIFEDVKKVLMKADTSELDRDFAIQCNIQGEGEGAFYIAFKEGVFSVEPYDYKDNDAQLYATGDTFIKMFNKKIKGREAFEQGLLGFDGSVEVIMLLEKLTPKKAGSSAEKKSGVNSTSEKKNDKKSD